MNSTSAPGDGDRPPRLVHGDEPMGDKILDAAAACVHDKGFDAVSLDEVAARAGVSRTTLYRRFGNRDSLFTALLWARSEPFRDWARLVLSGRGSVESRIETVIVHATLEMQRVGWLDASVRNGASPLAARLIVAAQLRNAGDGLGALVGSLLESREDRGDIDPPEVIEWMARQMISLASGRTWDEQSLRVRVRFFIVPVLTGATSNRPVQDRLDDIDAKLERISRAFDDG